MHFAQIRQFEAIIGSTFVSSSFSTRCRWNLSASGPIDKPVARWTSHGAHMANLVVVFVIGSGVVSGFPQDLTNLGAKLLPCGTHRTHRHSSMLSTLSKTFPDHVHLAVGGLTVLTALLPPHRTGERVTWLQSAGHDMVCSH